MRSASVSAHEHVHRVAVFEYSMLGHSWQDDPNMVAASKLTWTWWQMVFAEAL